MKSGEATSGVEANRQQVAVMAQQGRDRLQNQNFNAASSP